LVMNFATEAQRAQREIFGRGASGLFGRGKNFYANYTN
jgi:hypothetical protein